jgi:hypothetical protein
VSVHGRDDLMAKGCGVKSNLHLARSAGDLGAATVDTADLYLSGDILQAVAAQHLTKIRPDSIVVVDCDITPTAGMLQDGSEAPPREHLEEAIRQRAGSAVFVDAKRIAERVFGDISFGEPAAAPATLPATVKPLRVAVCTELSGDTVITLEWFTDERHLTLFKDRLAAIPGHGLVAVAEEAVLRGADWLERRWRDGGDRYKHMAVAMRAAGLTREEFSRRWRGHAGVGIPGDIREQAYVQNHPRWGPYDAVNEVYFDDIAGLRARAEWFEGVKADPELFAESRLISVKEVVICG